MFWKNQEIPWLARCNSLKPDQVCQLTDSMTSTSRECRMRTFSPGYVLLYSKAGPGSRFFLFDSWIKVEFSRKGLLQEESSWVGRFFCTS